MHAVQIKQDVKSVVTNKTHHTEVNITINIYYFQKVHFYSCSRPRSLERLTRRIPRDNLNSREGQTDSTPVDKYNFPWTTKGVRDYHKFRLQRVLKYDQTAKVSTGDYYKYFLIF